MNKLFTKIAAIALGASMATGVGVAVASNAKEPTKVEAAEEVYKHMVFNSTNNSKAVSSYSNSWTNTTDGFTWNLANWNNNNNQWAYIKAGNKKTAYVGTIVNAEAVDKAVTKVDVVIDAVTTANINSLKLYYGTSADPSTNETSITVGTGTKTVTIPSANQAANMYYKLAVDCKAASNGSFTLSDFKLYVDNTPTATYTVSFNGNGASGSMSAVTDVSGSYTLPANGFTVPTGKAFAGWKADNAGDLIAAGGSYTVNADVEFYAQWADAYDITYTAGTNGTGSYAHTSQPAGTYALLPFASLSGVSANSGYRFKNYTVGGVDKNPGDTITLSAATSVTVNFEVKPEETTYVFATNYSTYASSWSTSYGEKTLAGTTDVGGDYAATIVLARANKQSSGVGSDKPYICGNTNADAKMITFTLSEEGYKIKDVLVTFEQRGSNAPSMKLFKGDNNTGTALDSGTIGTKNTLSTSNLNDTIFTVTLNAGGTSNKGAGLTSIYISIEAQSAFGTLDHITVTGLPNVVYHVGETYDATGFAVTAYDGADEATANFKDITTLVETDLDDPTPFVEGDVPGFDCDVQYTGDGGTDTTSFHVYVYALVEYELITSAPADWSGEYLIVGSKTVESVTTSYAMNGSIPLVDVEGNHKVVTPDANDVIESGQELEWTISAYDTGYSIRGNNGKYIGWSSGSSNGLTASDTPLLNTLSMADGEVTITGSGGRQLTLNTDGQGRFRYYASGTVKLYKLKESSAADAYAQTFLGAIVCDATGATEPTYNWKEEGVTRWSWTLLAEEYDTLTAVEKEQFRLGVPSSTGTNIEKALAVYDYIVGKYNKGMGKTSEYPDFMERDPSPIGAVNNALLKNVNTENTIAIVVVISTISVSAIGGYFFLRRRKEHN